MTPGQYFYSRALKKFADKAKLRELRKKDNKDNDNPWGEDAKCSIKEDDAPMLANPFMSDFS